MASLKYEANSTFQTGTLGSSYTSGGVSLSLTSGHGARFPSSGDFWVRVEDEIFKVTARSTDTLTVVGAQDGTSASNHSGGVDVTWVLSVSALTQLRSDLLSSGVGASNSLYGTYETIRATSPSVDAAGQLAFCSDSIYTARWSGTAWQWFLRGTPVTPPQVTGQTTTVNGSHNNSTTTLNVNSNFSSPPSTPFFIMIGTEQLKVTSTGGGTNWTVTRADGSTTAGTYTGGETVTEMLYSWSDKTSNATYTNSGGILVIENSASAGGADGGVKMKVKLAYSAPWTIIAAVGFHYPQVVNNVAAGFALWDVAQPARDVRSTVSFIAGNVGYSTFDPFQWAGAGSNASAISGGTSNSPYGNSAITSIYTPTASDPMWVKITDDSTNWIFYMSNDKIAWRETGRVARNTYVTATHAGPFASPRNARAGVVLLSLEQFNSVV